MSLRALAREIGVHHSSLSAAIHDRRLTRGVSIGADGRVTVTDAEAAARCWKSIHIPQITEFRRMDQREEALRREVESHAEAEAHAEYTAQAVAAVLIALHVVGSDDRVAAIAALRTRFDYEAAAYLVDDSNDALTYFDQAVENALEWFADQADLEAEDEDKSPPDEKPKAKRARKVAK